MPKPNGYEIWPVNDPMPFPLSEVTVVSSDEYSAEVTFKLRMPKEIPFENTYAEVSAGIKNSWKFSFSIVAHRDREGKVFFVLNTNAQHVMWFESHGESEPGPVIRISTAMDSPTLPKVWQAEPTEVTHSPRHYDYLEREHKILADGRQLITVKGTHLSKLPETVKREIRDDPQTDEDQPGVGGSEDSDSPKNTLPPKPIEEGSGGSDSGTRTNPPTSKPAEGGSGGSDSGTPNNSPTSKPGEGSSGASDSGTPNNPPTFKQEENGSEGLDFGSAPKPPTSNPIRKFPLLFGGLGCLFILAIIIIGNIWFFDSEFGKDWTDNALVTLYKEGVPIPNGLLPPLPINTDTPTPTDNSVDVQPVFNFATNTATPTLTLAFTDTPIEVQPITGDIAFTPTPTAVKVGGGYTFPIVFTATVTQLSNCRFGDSPYFAYFTGLPVGARVGIYGTDLDFTWFLVGSIQKPDIHKMCWTKSDNLSFIGDPAKLSDMSEDVTNLPVSSQLPPATVTSVKSTSQNPISGDRNVTTTWVGSASPSNSATNADTPEYVFKITTCENGKAVEHTIGTNDTSVSFTLNGSGCGFGFMPHARVIEQHSISPGSYVYAVTNVDLSSVLYNGP